MQKNKIKLSLKSLGGLYLKSFKLIYTDIRMPINSFLLDQSQQSNYGIKGQFLPNHLLSGTYDRAQKEKQERGTECKNHGKQHTVLPVCLYPPKYTR